VGLRAGLDAVVKRKIPAPAGNQTQLVQLVLIKLPQLPGYFHRILKYSIKGIFRKNLKSFYGNIRVSVFLCISSSCMVRLWFYCF
jgi:hypothetical protein